MTLVYLVHTGEDIGVAACREVKEETGVEAEFEGVLCVRHQHNYKYGCSDLYFVCLLRALTDTVTACPEEIRAAKWMDVSVLLLSLLLQEKFAILNADKPVSDICVCVVMTGG